MENILLKIKKFILSKILGRKYYRTGKCNACGKCCTNLDPVTHKCKIHKNRPGICRRYPQEELFSMGGALSDDCGYKMEPIISFEEILKKEQKKKGKKKMD